MNISKESRDPCILHLVFLTFLNESCESEKYQKHSIFRMIFRIVLMLIALMTGKVLSGICDEENNRLTDMPM